MLNYPLLYLEHLSPRDLDLLAETAEGDSAEIRAQLVRHPEIVDDLLASPRLFERLLGVGRNLEPGVTPFLVFGVLVHRAALELRRASFVAEWSAPHKRLPVFDVAPLRDFLDDGGRRFFLIELLASFTRVAGGHWWVRTRRGLRRRRFSELDLVRLVPFVEQAPAATSPALYRRLGDVALFLSGVFPDHTAESPYDAVHRELLGRSAGLGAGEVAVGGGTDESALAFLETLGQRWYRRARQEAATRIGVAPVYLDDVAERFGAARRVLNHVSDRHLFHLQPGWLMGPGG